MYNDCLEDLDYVEEDEADYILCSSGETLSGMVQFCPLCFSESVRHCSDWANRNLPVWKCVSCGTEFPTAIDLLEVYWKDELELG